LGEKKKEKGKGKKREPEKFPATRKDNFWASPMSWESELEKKGKERGKRRKSRLIRGALNIAGESH